MTAMFKLQLSHLGRGKAQVRVVESPIGEPRQTMAIPFDPVALRGLLQVLEKGDLDSNRLADEELAALRELGVVQDGQLLGAEARNQRIGQRLFETLFPVSEDPNCNVRGALDAAIAQAQETGRAVPFQLRFDSDAVDLASLPWELICDRDGRHLVAEGRLRFTRYITFGQAIASFPVADCLEVLVITPRPVDTRPLDPNTERHAIEHAFSDLETRHRVRVQHLTPPTLDALVAAVNARPYHIVHFDGHGAFGCRCPVCGEFTPIGMPRCAVTPGCNGRLGDVEPEGLLAFERSRSIRTKHLIGAKELATVLSGRQVRLFVASACRSATVGGLSVFGSVGPRLVLAGVPAVVAMQFSVPAVSAARFASEFYAALARGESIAAAAAAGRSLLFEGGMWYIPAVYLRNRDGEGYIFRHRSWLYLRPAGAPPPDWGSLRAPDAVPYKFLNPYEITDHVVFCGREADTQRVLGELLHRRFAVLYGPPSIGKTSLINAGLSPELIERGYLVMTVQDYGDPVAMLRREVAASPALDVDLTGADDLKAVVSALLHGAERPLVVIFDEFDSFEQSATAEQRQAFARQFAAFVRADFPQPVSVLLALRGEKLGGLQELQTHVPDFFHGLIPLAPLSSGQARQAIKGPLTHHDPPMRYDPDFLENTLLPALFAEVEVDAVHPTHLQIVCHDLYQRARREDAVVIDRGHYPPGGAAAILSNYLVQTLAQSFPKRNEREPARALLKQMVSTTGEREFVTVAQAAENTGLAEEQTRAMLDVLLKAGLLEPRAEVHGPVTYSLGHRLLAQEVSKWFDREEALARCAQETLDRAWEDWYAGQYVARLEGANGASDVRTLLVGPNRLREIRERRQQVNIHGPQSCLLLRSAVHRRVDMGYWAHQLQTEAETRHLLERIHCVRDGTAPKEKDEQEQVILGAEALGLEQEDLGKSALARAAVAHNDGNVRHAAALALAALGLDYVDREQTTLAEAAPIGRRWRRVQALAQIKTAGFSLPQLPLLLLAQVNAWQAGIRLFEARWRLVAQAVGAGLVSGLLLMLLMAPVWLTAGYRHLGEIASYLLIGLVVGALFACGRWLFDVLLGNQAGRVLGGAAGFGLGLLTLAPFANGPSYLQLLGGLLAGAAVATGWELLACPARPSALWRPGLGGALGGGLIFAATSLSRLRLPFVLKAEFPVFLSVQDQLLQLVLVVTMAALMGAAVGAGLATGGAAGEVLLRLPFVPRHDSAVCHESRLVHDAAAAAARSGADQPSEGV